MSSVWVIEDGDYSDYRVVGVFSSKENAECVAAACGLGVDSVAEWPIDPALDEINAGLLVFNVEMQRDGTVKYAAQDEDCINRGRVSTSEIGSCPWFSVHESRFGGPSFIRAHVWASDREHAIKIVNEKRVQAIANGKWPAPAEGQ